MTSATRDEYRFSVEDETRIGATVTAAYLAWGEPRTTDAATADALERLGAHSIGCSVDDLRGSERQMIRRVIAGAELARRCRGHAARAVGDDHTGRVIPWGGSELTD